MKPIAIQRSSGCFWMRMIAIARPSPSERISAKIEILNVIRRARSRIPALSQTTVQSNV